MYNRDGAKTATDVYSTADQRENQKVMASEYENLDEIAKLQEKYNRNRTMTGNTGVLNNHGKRFTSQYQQNGTRISTGYRKAALGSQETFSTTQKSTGSRHSKAFVEQNMYILTGQNQ